jgi:ABC-type lipoprotein release transport system permease subunit
MLRSLLYGVGALDPLTFTGAAGIILTAAIAASLIPAWRASRVDPAITLKD